MQSERVIIGPVEADKRNGLINYVKILIKWGKEERGRKPNTTSLVKQLSDVGIKSDDAKILVHDTRVKLLNERVGLDRVTVASSEEIKAAANRAKEAQKAIITEAMKALKKSRPDDSLIGSTLENSGFAPGRVRSTDAPKGATDETRWNG